MNKRYRVMMRESFESYVDVCADSRDEARKLVEEQVERGEVVALRDYDDFERKTSVVRRLAEAVRGWI